MPNQAQQAAVLNGGQQENTPRHRRPRHIFRITYCTTLAEWSFTAIAVGALGFYIFAVIDARSQNLHTQLHYKLLVAYVLMSAYMRLCYILTTISKTYLLFQQGPCETTRLPGERHIGTISSLMFLVEPAHFICLCWITHLVFPMRPCKEEEISYYTCRALWMASTIFVGMWIVTGLAMVALICTVTFMDTNRNNNSRWWEGTIGGESAASALRLTALPDPLRDQIVASLPTTSIPPADGEPCAICFETDTQDEWRILPCGHRFHPLCVDEWIKMHHGTCPTCRHDPIGPRGTGASDTTGFEQHVEIRGLQASGVTASRDEALESGGGDPAVPAVPSGGQEIHVEGQAVQAIEALQSTQEPQPQPLGEVLQQMVHAGTAPPGAAPSAGAGGSSGAGPRAAATLYGT